MSMLKKFVEWIRKPKGLGLILIHTFTLIFTICSILFLVIDLTQYEYFITILSYICFSMNGLFLGYTTYTFVIYRKIIKEKFIHLAKRHTKLNKFISDYGYKTIVLSLISLFMTLSLTVFYIVMACINESIWYGSIAIYYFLLVTLKISIIISARIIKNKELKYSLVNEYSYWKVYFIVGIFLILLEIAVAGAITQMIIVDTPAKYGEIMAIVNAAYTFYKMGLAIYNIFKAHKYDSPVIQSLRNLNFADACMSLVYLTIILITTFNKDNDSLLYIKAIVGFAACLAIISMAIFMIIKSIRRIKIIKKSFKNIDDNESFKQSSSQENEDA